MGRLVEIPFEALDQFERAAYGVAHDEAATGLAEGGVPVGAALVRDGVVVASGRNRRVQEGDPIAHGEMNCLRVAGRQRTYADTTLFTTLAPCMMCTGAILQFGIPRVVVGEARSFDGNLGLLVDAGVDVVLLDHAPSAALMAEFVATSPAIWAEDIAESD